MVAAVVAAGFENEKGAAAAVALGAGAPNSPVEAVVVAAAPNSEGAAVVAAGAPNKDVGAVEPDEGRITKDRKISEAKVDGSMKQFLSNHSLPKSPPAAVVGAALPKVGKGVEATVEAGAVAGAPNENAIL